MLEHVEIIESEIRRLDEVVQGFLKFTRPEDLRLQPVRVSSLFDEILPVIEPEAHKNNVRVGVECPASVPNINGDAGDAASGLSQSGDQRLSGDAERRLAAARVRHRPRANRWRCASRTPVSEYLRKISRRSLTFTSRRSIMGPASVCRWSTASSSCTTARSKSVRPRAWHDIPHPAAARARAVSTRSDAHFRRPMSSAHGLQLRPATAVVPVYGAGVLIVVTASGGLAGCATPRLRPRPSGHRRCGAGGRPACSCRRRRSRSCRAPPLPPRLKFARRPQAPRRGHAATRPADASQTRAGRCGELAPRRSVAACGARASCERCRRRTSRGQQRRSRADR